MQAQSKQVVNTSYDDNEEEDIEKAIANEVQNLKAVEQSDRRFQNCQTGAKNCIFIKTTLEDPVQLAYAIFSDMQKTKIRKARYALRLLPVVGTCKANMSSVETLAMEVLAPYFTDTKFEITYTINFKARNNSGLGRETVISVLRKIITESFPSVLTRYTTTSPYLTIMAEVMCGVCCIAVAKDFAVFRKYNLVEVASERPTASDQTDNMSGKPDSESTNNMSASGGNNTNIEARAKSNDDTSPVKAGSISTQQKGNSNEGGILVIGETMSIKPDHTSAVKDSDIGKNMSIKPGVESTNDVSVIVDNNMRGKPEIQSDDGPSAGREKELRRDDSNEVHSEEQ